MAITSKSLAAGQIASTKTTIYTCPGSTVAYIHEFITFNTGATDETVIIYCKRSGGTSRVVDRGLLMENEKGLVEFAGPLSAGDEIEAETTNGSTVDYTITGAEEA